MECAGYQTDEAQCIAIDLHVWGPEAQEDPDNIGAGALLDFQYDASGAVSVDILGGRGDRRLLVNSEALRFALAEAGVPWVKERRS